MKRAGFVVLLGATIACATLPYAGSTAIPLAPPPRPIAELVAQLSAPDAPSRASAAWALTGAHTASDEVVAALKAAREDPSGPVREAAAWALGHLKLADSQKGADSTDAPPRLLVQPRPTYPSLAYARKIQGTVLVEILINETGRVSHAEVRKSIPGLDEAALACVRSWQFSPAQRGGRPVATFAQAPVTFRIY